MGVGFGEIQSWGTRFAFGFGQRLRNLAYDLGIRAQEIVEYSLGGLCPYLIGEILKCEF